MSDDKQDLAYHLKASEESYPSDLKQRAKESPYSQPLQRMAKLAGLANNADLLSYSWDTDNQAERDTPSAEYMEVGMVKLRSSKKHKKSKRKRKSKAPLKAPVNLASDVSSDDNAESMDSYTTWLSATVPTPGLAAPSKSRSHQSKKKRKKRKKPKIGSVKAKIHDSVKDKDEIASTALAAL